LWYLCDCIIFQHVQVSWSCLLWFRKKWSSTWWPDLTLLDFFLWGYIKDLVHRTKVQDVDKLQCWITAACETVTPVMLQNTRQEVEYCLELHWATKGAHVEFSWGTWKLGNFLHVSVQFPFFYLY
jgi:hypothetical protein